MKIENAKKIEVWQFEDKDKHTCYFTPNGLAYSPQYGYFAGIDDLGNEEYKQYFAELEAKEQEQESSEWVEFASVNDSGLIGWYRTKDDGATFEYNGALGWVSLPDYSRDKSIKFTYKTYVKPKQESESEKVQKAMNDFISESAVKYQLTIGKDAEERIKSIVRNEIDAYMIQVDNSIKTSVLRDIESLKLKVNSFENLTNTLNDAMIVNHRNISITKNLVDCVSPEMINKLVEEKIDSYLEQKFDTVKQVVFSSINQTNAKHSQYADSVNSQINSLQLVIKKIEKLLKNITNEFSNSYADERMKRDPYYNEIESNENE